VLKKIDNDQNGIMFKTGVKLAKKDLGSEKD
jgi:hypothetical protein